MKVLFVGTHPKFGTGYSRVGNKITNYLANIPGVEVLYYATQYWEDQFLSDIYVDHRIKLFNPENFDPNTYLCLGFNGLKHVIHLEKPDILFIYNDLPVTLNYLEAIPENLLPKQIYLYLDIVFPWERLLYFKLLKTYKNVHFFTFLDFWRNHLINDLNFKEDRVTTLPHGVDFDQFEYIETGKAKKLLGLESDDFLIINMNRNSSRKMYDVNIRAFLDFLIDMDLNPKIKMYFGGDIDRSGVGIHLLETLITECLVRKIDPAIIIENNAIFNSNVTLKSNKDINLIFQAADVGMNTCCGEGFGMIQVEHAYCNKPQIVTDLGVFRETLGPYGFYAKPSNVITTSGAECIHGHMYIAHESEFVKHLKYIYENKPSTTESKEYIQSKHSWENAYKVLDRFFRN